MKANRENVLTEEQLGGVAGGSWMESYGVDLENAFSRKLPGFEKMNPVEPETMSYCLQNWDKVIGQLKTMFANHGIEMTYNGKPFDPNIYSYKGKQITRDQAWDIIDGK